MEISYNGGLLTLLSVIFAILKIIGIVEISWWIIAIPFATDLIFAIVMAIIAFRISKKTFNNLADILMDEKQENNEIVLEKTTELKDGVKNYGVKEK